MKIDQPSKPIGNSPATTALRSGSPGAVNKAAPAPTKEGGLPSAVVASSLNTLTDTEPAFNAQRVSEIRQAISEGRFQVNAERIADGLINSVREMLAQGQRSK